MHDCFTIELTGECLKCLFRLTGGVPAVVVQSEARWARIPEIQVQARSSHRFEGSNEPPFVRQVSFFFSCSLYERAPCLVITRRLCSSNTEIWSNGTVNVCTKAVRWASPRPRLRCDQGRRGHFSSSSIAQRAVCHSCKVLQSTMKRTKESDMDGQAKLFSFGFSRGRSGN